MRSKDIESSLGSTSTGLESQAKQVNSNDTDNNEDDEFTGFDDDGDDDDDDDDNNNQATSPQKQSSISDTTWLSTYTTAFWETIAREWSGVDQWRMNKFLLLTRFVLRETFHICLASYLGIEETEDAPSENDATASTATSTWQSQKRKDTTSTSTTPPSKKAKKSTSSSSSSSTPAKSTTSDPTPTTQQIHILSTHPLSPRSRAVSDGLRLHMLDIYTDELSTVLTALKPALTASVPETNAYAERVRKVLSEEFMAPVRNVAVEGLARHVRAKAKEVLAEWEERSVEELS